MLDTMTLTKAVGSVCAALLILLLSGWAASGLFNVGGGHGEDHLAGYVIMTDDDEAVEEEEVEEVPFSEILASADPADGEGLWRQCRACHVVEPGVHGVGPSLHGVVGRQIASFDDFSYSDALGSMDAAWTPEELNAFLENPRDYAPGTAMSYGGMRDVEDRAAMVAYLDSLDE